MTRPTLGRGYRQMVHPCSLEETQYTYTDNPQITLATIYHVYWQRPTADSLDCSGGVFLDINHIMYITGGCLIIVPMAVIQQSCNLYSFTFS